MAMGRELRSSNVLRDVVDTSTGSCVIHAVLVAASTAAARAVEERREEVASAAESRTLWRAVAAVFVFLWGVWWARTEWFSQLSSGLLFGLTIMFVAFATRGFRELPLWADCARGM